MIIYFRVCERQESISHVHRWNNLSKTEIIKRCWLSLQEGISKNDLVILIQDQVSANTLSWLKNTSKSKLIQVDVPEHAWDYHQHTVTLITVLKDYIAKNPSQDHFILEDDYLFTPSGLQIFKDTASSWQSGFIVPYDYIDRYKDHKPAVIILGPDRHWRTVNSITMTVAAKGFIWSKFLKQLDNAAPTSNDAVFEGILQEVPCISPMPGLASHLTPYHTSPYLDTTTIWEYYSKKL